MTRVPFYKDEQGWYFPKGGVPRKDLAMVNGADELLDLLNPDKNPSINILVQPDSGNYPNQKLLDEGFNGLVKQAVVPSGGCTYVCPTLNGQYLNLHLWLNEQVALYFGNFANVIYFK